MKRILTVLVLLYSCQVAVCYAGTPQQVLSPINMTEPVQIDAEASLTSDGRILVKGKTNLPEQCDLSVSIANETIGFRAQGSTKVSKGVFLAGPLGPKSGVSHGKYSIEVFMSSSDDQPKSVTMAIGKEGEYLSGPLVAESLWGGKRVEYKFSYSVGSEQSISETESKHKAHVNSIKNTVIELINTGHLMEQYRNTGNHSALRTCGNMMRKYQAIAKKTRDEADNLPLKYFDLKVAATETILCVSCADYALESCQRAAESLNNKE